MTAAAPSAEFRRLSARCGKDPLRVQGPGGNTSVKDGGTMWIKASGTELAEAETGQIFVAVDLAAARAEAAGAGDGTCVAAVLDKTHGLRPSIETTFHAALDWPVVAHTHSVATIVHAISPAGVAVAREKLRGLPVAFVDYRKPGLPLTREIVRQCGPDTRVVILRNHGLIVAGATVGDVSDLMDEVEARLEMPVLVDAGAADTNPTDAAPEGYAWAAGAAILGLSDRLCALAGGGSYYPDHVVFLGPGLPTEPSETSPAVLVAGVGAALKRDATPAQAAMLQCLADVLSRLPEAWAPEAIGPEAERELLNWDAEKYRQALAARSP